ncbi:sporulation protein [Nocardiopsis sp. NPDC007018]|uniref:sporulation protein n=1 Tax=Nocardiopsis sp. NPDC007018 TaxID=3155721 RepID=UPI0033F2955D
MTLSEIGLAAAEPIDDHVGLAFPRSLSAALQTAGTFWSSMDRRHFLTATAFSAAAFGPPTLRWLSQNTDDASAHTGGRRIGRADITELSELAEQARHTDSRFGGASAGVSAVAVCLRDVASPMLGGTYTDAVGKELFAATAVLGRLAGWADFDAGHHPRAQRQFIQALRMSRAAGEVALGGYVLSCMALQACLRDYHDDALDMIDAATSATRHSPPRVRAFLYLVEARVHARARSPKAAGQALAVSERLLERADSRTGDDPTWIDFHTRARLAADAVEIHRDLGRPAEALRWNEEATMPADRFARSYGIRMAVVSSAHVQARDLEAALPAAHTSVDILGRVASQRARDYLDDLVGRFAPWRSEPEVRLLTDRVGSGASPSTQR